MIPPESLHPQIARFAAVAQDEMSTELAAHIIGIHRQTVVSLCQGPQPKIEVSAIAARGNERRKYTLTRAGVLAYIIRSTAGPRDAVLHAIEVLCPVWLPFARKIAEPPAPRSTARPRAATDVHAAHPDLFR
ncbi:MAG: hypothetical protein ACO1TE_29240 [Prosthecobacter sp.]